MATSNNSANDSSGLTTQVQERLAALLELLEKDDTSLSSASPEISQSGSEAYGKFIDAVHRGLDNLDD